MIRKDTPKAPVLILGARSDVGRALAHEYARAGYPIYLAARQAERLRGDTADLSIRYGVKASLYEFDVLAFNAHADFVRSLPVLPEIVICVVGLMTDQKAAERDFAAAQAMMLTNYVGPASILGEFANAMEQRDSGTIIGLSSIAGERGRASNYIYGSSKAGLSTFLQGLRIRCRARGCEVMTVKPGFVNTKMTEQLRLPKSLIVEPESLARKIRNQQTKKMAVGYPNLTWKIIAFVVRILPESIIRLLPA
jgi:decaprenylphospho-beta-D-erythro-pentofuranosid-2-ulose 2-reductase